MKKSSSFVKVLSVAMILAAANSFFGCKNNSDSEDETDTSSTTKPAEEQKEEDQKEVNLLTTNFKDEKWVTNTYGEGVAATFERNEASLVAKVTQADMDLKNYSNGIQLQYIVKVEDETSYTVTFDITADKDAKSKWALMSGKPDYAWYAGEDLVLNAGEKKSVKATAKISSTNPEGDGKKYNSKLDTIFGIDFLSVANFTVENVKIVKVKPAAGTPATKPGDGGAGTGDDKGNAGGSGSGSGSGSGEEGTQATEFTALTTLGDASIKDLPKTATLVYTKEAFATVPAGKTVKVTVDKGSITSDEVWVSLSSDGDLGNAPLTLENAQLAKVKENGLSACGGIGDAPLVGTITIKVEVVDALKNYTYTTQIGTAQEFEGATSNVDELVSFESNLFTDVEAIKIVVEDATWAWAQTHDSSWTDASKVNFGSSYELEIKDADAIESFKTGGLKIQAGQPVTIAEGKTKGKVTIYKGTAQ